MELVEGNLLLSPLIEYINGKGCYKVGNKSVHFYSKTEQCFVHTGRYPLSPEVKVPARDLSSKLHIRFRSDQD